MSSVTIVEYFGSQSEYRCGYCKSADTNYSHGMWAHTMTAQDYQNLINRGWRRSGQYVYKPTNHRTCCPAYTINCHALEIKLSKSQKKVLKRFNRYLSGNDVSQEASRSKNCDGKEAFPQTSENITCIAPRDGLEPTKNVKLEQMDSANENTSFPAPSQNPSVLSVLSTKSTSTCNTENEDLQVDVDASTSTSTLRSRPKKAKEIRLQRKINKLLAKGIEPSTVIGKNKPEETKCIEDFFKISNDQSCKSFRIKTVKVESVDFESTFEQEFLLYQNYQMKVHQDKESDCTRKQYKRFLCDNPFSDQTDELYGTYHQHYYVDDVLIAVGVIDMLPTCVSSVYFFYSTDLMHLSLGTFGALREIAYVRELNKLHSSIRYYYMGFYIHSCVKMRYKGAFVPSYLLCPEMYTWHLLDEHVRQKLSEKKYSRLNSCTEVPAHDAPVVMNDARILFRGHRMTFEIYNGLSSNSDREEVEEYVKFVGSTCAKSMLLYRSEN